MSVRQDSEPMPIGETIGLLAYSDEMDKQLALRLAAWSEGFAAGRSSRAGDYETGFVAGCTSVKRAQRDAHRLLEDDACRWQMRGEKRTRQTFGEPHPDDYRGGAA